jgi:hypothetical protein
MCILSVFLEGFNSPIYCLLIVTASFVIKLVVLHPFFDVDILPQNCRARVHIAHSKRRKASHVVFVEDSRLLFGLGRQPLLGYRLVSEQDWIDRVPSAFGQWNWFVFAFGRYLLASVDVDLK